LKSPSTSSIARHALGLGDGELRGRQLEIIELGGGVHDGGVAALADILQDFARRFLRLRQDGGAVQKIGDQFGRVGGGPLGQLDLDGFRFSFSSLMVSNLSTAGQRRTASLKRSHFGQRAMGTSRDST
jgi:hypothetical protein